MSQQRTFPGVVGAMVVLKARILSWVCVCVWVSVRVMLLVVRVAVVVERRVVVRVVVINVVVEVAGEKKQVLDAEQPHGLSFWEVRFGFWKRGR